ncbi:hypothetical protein [Faecalibacterium prausnitzii]|uniref:hypothetical protein n=1 Tax=Faecalibacterium prausnitzii TaxID=853 RepID=UPI001A9A40C4|nr:hypothetical protein [Faecalibacterium prausnitzii]
MNGRRAALAIFSGMNTLIYQWENLRIFPLIFSQGGEQRKSAFAQCCALKKAVAP